MGYVRKGESVSQCEIKFQVEADQEADAHDLMEALYEAFTRAARSTAISAPNIATVKITNREIVWES